MPKAQTTCKITTCELSILFYFLLSSKSLLLFYAYLLLLVVYVLKQKSEEEIFALFLLKDKYIWNVNNYMSTKRQPKHL